MILIAVVSILMLMCLFLTASLFTLTKSSDSEKETSSKATEEVEPDQPSGQYVKLIHTVAYDENAEGNIDDKNRIINLAELEVFDASGKNLAANKSVTGSSEYPAPHVWSNLTDGNKTNFAHTYGRTPSEYDSMTVDLGAVKEIKKIVITNRTSCCKPRAKGVKIVIYDADGTTVVKETPAISTVADVYTLTFPENVWS